MEIKLLITTIGYLISALFCSGLGIFVFLKNRKGLGNILFLLMNLSIAVYQISYAVGINIPDPYLSRFVFMFNLASMFAITFNIHVVYWMTGDAKRKKKLMWVLYSIATIFSIFFILNPDSFLLPSVPKLYYPNFFEPGKLYSLGDYYFYTAVLLFFYHCFASYRRANQLEKRRLKYFFIGNVYGYVVAILPAFLLYNIPIDPFWSFLFGLYPIPLAYAIIRYDLIDIRIIAKRALAYALVIGGITFSLIIINSISDTISNRFPVFPIWIVPFFSGIVAVAIGVLIWRKIREVDTLKYEFVNVVTHKFRTPLTYIKWSLDTLTKSPNQEEQKVALDTIETANIRLVELTGALVGLTSSENDNDYKYTFEQCSIDKMLRDIRKLLELRINEKNLTFTFDISSNLPLISIDKKKIQFALQTVIENSLIYTPKKGGVHVSAKIEGKNIVIEIKDTGIGINEDELPLIFSKFFRGSGAKQADTEGMGIGLYLSKEIISRHHGEISAYSEGKDKGTDVTIKIPL